MIIEMTLNSVRFGMVLELSVLLFFQNIFLEVSDVKWGHGRPQNSFLGRAKYIMDRSKGYLNTFQSQILIQIRYFVPKISQMSNSWTVLPIGSYAHENYHFNAEIIAIIINVSRYANFLESD